MPSWFSCLPNFASYWKNSPYFESLIKQQQWANKLIRPGSIWFDSIRDLRLFILSGRLCLMMNVTLSLCVWSNWGHFKLALISNNLLYLSSAYCCIVLPLSLSLNTRVVCKRLLFCAAKWTINQTTGSPILRLYHLYRQISFRTKNTRKRSWMSRIVGINQASHESSQNKYNKMLINLIRWPSETARKQEWPLWWREKRKKQLNLNQN